MQPLYLDYNATTPLDPRVFEAMKEWYLGPPGNAGSRTHVYGQRAKDAVETARKQVADVIGAKAEEIFFTSGATESNNLAILGLTAYGERSGRKHIISTAIEHKAVLEPLAEMQRRGFEVELAPVTSGGYVEPDSIRDRLRRDTLLVSVMHANNETGVVQPVHEIAKLIAGSETYFHTDGAQTFGKDVDELRSLPCDFISISAHKIHGPQGIGALYVRRRGGTPRSLDPLVHGGGQERGLRPGTLPIALAIGLGEAAKLAAAEHAQRRQWASAVKQRLLSDLQAVEHYINGTPSRCQAHVLNVSFPGVDSEALMMAVRGIVAMSNGSACTSASYSPSHVLTSMGLGEQLLSSAVRISWGPRVGEIPVAQIIAAIRVLRS
ncbi:MAG: aminotransferase class V-fold PLP-dependent enzyme [Planctomycetota bacterium]|nr:aminotransferase class V-fold PLP-dependent enzyme [Planctomycetota bacterium]